MPTGRAMPIERGAAVECAWPIGAELGEGPMWSAAEQALWFVDIKGHAIHRLHEPTGTRQSWQAPAQPGFIVPTAHGSYLCGLKGGLHRFDPRTGAFELLHAVEPHAPGNRLNDGCVDAQGFLWFGSMDDGERRPSGALYQLCADGCRQRDGGYVVTNGPAVSPDGRTLYHTDTLGRVIYAFTRAPDGALTEKRIFARISSEGAYPDGPIVDVEGCVWTGLYGGWGLERYAPDGRLLGSLSLPCANVTKAAFGGPDLRTLYITTAWKGLTAAERSEQPLAGALFRVRIEVPGLPQATVRHGL